MICKWCSFECDMGKYSSCPMNKALYSLDMCYIFPYRTKNEQRLYFLTRSSHIWHDCHILQFKLGLPLECDMGWYRYTSPSKNHCAECEKLPRVFSYCKQFCSTETSSKIEISDGQSVADPKGGGGALSRSGSQKQRKRRNMVYNASFNLFKPEFTIVTFTHYKPQITVAILEIVVD